MALSLVSRGKTLTADRSFYLEGNCCFMEASPRLQTKKLLNRASARVAMSSSRVHTRPSLQLRTARRYRAPAVCLGDARRG